jgi:hypothetical protein
MADQESILTQKDVENLVKILNSLKEGPLTVSCSTFISWKLRADDHLERHGRYSQVRSEGRHDRRNRKEYPDQDPQEDRLRKLEMRTSQKLQRKGSRRRSQRPKAKVRILPKKQRRMLRLKQASDPGIPRCVDESKRERCLNIESFRGEELGYLHWRLALSLNTHIKRYPHNPVITSVHKNTITPLISRVFIMNARRSVGRGSPQSLKRVGFSLEADVIC